MDTAILSAEEKFKLVESVTDEEWHSYMRHFMAECDKTSRINYLREKEAKLREKEAKKREREAKKWQSVVAGCKAEIAEKDAALAEQRAENERLRALLKG